MGGEEIQEFVISERVDGTRYTVVLNKPENSKIMLAITPKFIPKEQEDGEQLWKWCGRKAINFYNANELSRFIQGFIMALFGTKNDQPLAVRFSAINWMNRECLPNYPALEGKVSERMNNTLKTIEYLLDDCKNTLRNVVDKMSETTPGYQNKTMLSYVLSNDKKFLHLMSGYVRLRQFKLTLLDSDVDDQECHFFDPEAKYDVRPNKTFEALEKEKFNHKT